MSERFALWIVLDPVARCRASLGWISGEAAGHEVDHREVDHGFGAVWVGLVVTGEAAVMDEPAETSLDGPAPRDHCEAAGSRGSLDGVDVDAEAGAVVDGGGAVAGIHPRLRTRA